jgi:hypothetical protein
MDKLRVRTTWYWVCEAGHTTQLQGVRGRRGSGRRPRRRLETLRDDLATGFMAAEEQAVDVDHGDRAATRRAETSLHGLQAAHAAVVAALVR